MIAIDTNVLLTATDESRPYHRDAGRLRQLGLTYGFHGKRLHDANIVATMSTHGIRVLITENPGDFALFDEIDLVTVADAAI